MDNIYIIYMRTIFLELNMQYYMSQRNKMRLLFFFAGVLSKWSERPVKCLNVGFLLSHWTVFTPMHQCRSYEMSYEDIDGCYLLRIRLLCSYYYV